MCQVAERLRQPPGRKRVRAVPLVNHRHCAFEKRRRQIRIKSGDLCGHHKAFVDNRPARQARHIEWIVRACGGSRQILGLFSDDIEFPFQLRTAEFAAVNEALHNHRLLVPGFDAEDAPIGWNFAPAKQLESFALDRLFQNGPAVVPTCG